MYKSDPFQKSSHISSVLACGTINYSYSKKLLFDNSQKNILFDLLKIHAIILLIINVNIFKNTSLNQRVLLGNVIIKYAYISMSS